MSEIDSVEVRTSSGTISRTRSKVRSSWFTISSFRVKVLVDVGSDQIKGHSLSQDLPPH